MNFSMKFRTVRSLIGGAGELKIFKVIRNFPSSKIIPTVDFEDV